MKAPKKNRVLECDNQMSQAFARAMQNSRKELEVMQDQAYNDGFSTGDDWANTINTVTTMLALRKLHGFSTKRLLDVINCANEFVGQGMRYRKKPVVIDAVQWTGTNHRGRFRGGLVIKTLEGEHLANIGDYIIKGVHGEFYPCKPDIFRETYEEVEA